MKSSLKNAYPHLSKFWETDSEFELLTLPESRLREIEEVLSAYYAGKIDFEEPCDENGEYICGAPELIILDPTYEEQGVELSVLRWCEGHIPTEWLIEDLTE